MKILITGSSGFIGTALTNALLADGHELLGLDRKTPLPSMPAHGFVECDLLDGPRLAAAISDFGPETIVHLAARTGIKEVPPGSPHYAVNTIGTANLIAAARSCGSVQRIIFTSTKYVHRGERPAHARDYQPTTSYGRSKAEMEKLVWEQDGGGCDWCIVRPTTVWGPGMGAHYQGFLRLLTQGRYFHIGRRPVHKHLAYIGNITHQYRALLQAPGSAIHRQVFYLTDYEPVELHQWAELLRQALDAPAIRTLPIGMARLLAMGGDLLTRCGWRKFPFTSFRLQNLTVDDLCDASLTQSVCGPLPVTLAQAVDQTARWYLQLPRP